MAAPPGGDRRGREGTGGDARLPAGCIAGWPAAREPDASAARRWERSPRRDTMALSRASRGCRNARFLSLPRGTNCPPGARRPAGQRWLVALFSLGTADAAASAAVHCAHPTPGRSKVPLACRAPSISEQLAKLRMEERADSRSFKYFDTFLSLSILRFFFPHS